MENNFVKVKSDASLVRDITSDAIINRNKSEIDKLQKSIDKFGVLIFRNQSLTDDEQVKFSEYYGKIDHY